MDEQNWNNQNEHDQYYHQQMPQKQDNGLAVAGMILGIASIPMSCCLGIYGLVIGIIGLILSIVSRKRTKGGIGVAGIVCSVIGIVIGLLMILLSVFFIEIYEMMLNEMMDDPMYQEMLNEILSEIQ